MNPNGVSYFDVYEGMFCRDDDHADDCPCRAGGDAILRDEPEAETD
jgi:hypothetical protein